MPGFCRSVPFCTLDSPDCGTWEQRTPLRKPWVRSDVSPPCKLTALTCTEIQGYLDDGKREKEEVLRATPPSLAFSLLPFEVCMPSLEPREQLSNKLKISSSPRRWLLQEEQPQLKQAGFLKDFVLSHFSRVRLFVTPWTIAFRLLCPWDYPGKNTGVGCHALFQGNLPHPGIKPVLLMSPALAGRFFTTSTTWEAPKDFKSALKIYC